MIVTDRRILKELEPLWAKCFGFYHATLAPSPGNTMDEAQVAGLIPPSVATFAVIPVGWPLGRFGPVRRKPAAQVTHWDRW